MNNDRDRALRFNRRWGGRRIDGGIERIGGGWIGGRIERTTLEGGDGCVKRGRRVDIIIDLDDLRLLPLLEFYTDSLRYRNHRKNRTYLGTSKSKRG